MSMTFWQARRRKAKRAADEKERKERAEAAKKTAVKTAPKQKGGEKQ